ncbi:MAG TPA: pyridoxamine 5'-phosphate oxidase family protein [Candidatus Acidoferrales bacterium]
MDRAFLHSFIAGCKYGVVPSVAADGAPQSALVGIAVTPALEIIFDTVNSSRKYRNLVSRPNCSLVVGWAGELTVQYEGLAELPSGAELRRFQEVYFAAWPDGVERMSWAGIAYFVVRPSWIRYSDFNQRPALVEEMRFS